MKFIFFLIFSTIGLNIQAQVDIRWQQLSNMPTANRAIHLERLSDGSFVTVGHSFLSFADNVPNVCNSGHSRIPVIKYNVDGSILWQRCLGIDKRTRGNYVIETVDKGLLVVGYGDDTYLEQMRIFRLDSLGNILWIKGFGGSGYDRAYSVTKTNDGGYVIVGETNASDNDLIGTGYHGAFDLVVFKLDDSGNMIWKKCFGGSGNDQLHEGIVVGTSVLEMADGSLFVAGRTESNNHNVAGNNGGSDGWLIKLSSNGTLLWQKCYGGTGYDQFVSIALTNDGFLMVGKTASNDGSVIGNHGSDDIWLVKTDFLGNVQWQKCIGGSAKDVAGNVVVVQDGFVLTGYSRSSNGDFENNFGAEDAFIAKVNLNGELQWMKSYGGSDRDWFQNIVRITDNDFLVCGATFSFDFDVKGNLHPNCAWILRFGEVNFISGKVFIDLDSNGLQNNNEPILPNISIETLKNGFIINSGFTNDTGVFSYSVDTGSLTVRPALNPQYYNISPNVFSSNHSSFGHSDTLVFGITPKIGIKDLAINLVPLSPSRAGFKADYLLICYNQGTEAIANSTVQMKFDSIMSFVESSKPYHSLIENQLTWLVSDLLPFDTIKIKVRLQIPAPPAVEMGTPLLTIANIKPIIGDTLPENNDDTLIQLVTGSFDPNDKAEGHGGKIKFASLGAGKELSYFIRFQNVGNDTAFNITVRDTLDHKVDYSTVSMKIASHPYQFSIENGNVLVWRFDDILLPDSTTNEEGSHGYIMYTVQPGSYIAIGDTIHNSASIYFDFNLPVRTNDAFTVVENDFVILPIGLLEFSGWLNQSFANLKWKTTSGKYTKFEIERSIEGRYFSYIGTRFSAISSQTTQSFEFKDYLSVVPGDIYHYRLKMYHAGGYHYSKVITLRSAEDKNRFNVRPNPSQHQAFFIYKASEKGNVFFTIYDLSGRVVLTQASEVEKGNNVISVKEIEKVLPGNYFAQVEQNGIKAFTKLTIVR